MNRSVRRRITKLVKKAKAKGIILRKNDPITKTLQNLWRDLDNNFEVSYEEKLEKFIINIPLTNTTLLALPTLCLSP